MRVFYLHGDSYGTRKKLSKTPRILVLSNWRRVVDDVRTAIEENHSEFNVFAKVVLSQQKHLQFSTEFC